MAGKELEIIEFTPGRPPAVGDTVEIDGVPRRVSRVLGVDLDSTADQLADQFLNGGPDNPFAGSGNPFNFGSL